MIILVISEECLIDWHNYGILSGHINVLLIRHQLATCRLLMNNRSFCRYTDKLSVLTGIYNTKYRGGELTDIVSISKLILDVFNPFKGDRNDAQNIAVMITDGAPNFPDFVYVAQSVTVQNTRGVGVFIVCKDGKNGCHEQCAKDMSSAPQTVRHTVINASFQPRLYLYEYNPPVQSNRFKHLWALAVSLRGPQCLCWLTDTVESQTFPTFRGAGVFLACPTPGCTEPFSILPRILLASRLLFHIAVCQTVFFIIIVG